LGTAAHITLKLIISLLYLDSPVIFVWAIVCHSFLIPKFKFYIFNADEISPL
jgi:hypothetical protein